MRKQYHSRVTEQGHLIWDVHRLVRLSRDLPRVEVSVSSIRELDESFWFDNCETPPTCRQVADHARLIQETSLGHPIILSANGRVMDGMHRVAKAYIDGLDILTAVQFPQDPEPDFIDVDVESLPYDHED